MTMLAHTDEAAREKFGRALRLARRRIVQARLAGALATGLSRGIWLAGAGVVVVAAAQWFVVHEWPAWWESVAGGALLGLMVGFGRPVWNALRHGPSLRETAERLDAAAGTENRIATALEFAEAGTAGPFIVAAIADGEAQLRRHAADVPLLPGVDWRWGRKILGTGAVAAVAAAVLFVAWHAAVGLPGKRGVPRVVTPRTTVAMVDPVNPVTTAPGAVDNATSRPSRPTGPMRASPAEASALASTNGKKTPANASAASDSPDAKASPAAAESAGTSGAAASKMTGASANSKPRKPSEPKTDLTPPTTPKGEERGARSSTGGGRGAGGKSEGVESTWQQHDMADPPNQEDIDADLQDPDKDNPNDHKGAVQPLLQDRKAAPTRELGISSDKGSGGTGRGGPTPVKKSRGAGALLMAVPLPDVVPGQLQPGPSRVNQEMTEPRPLQRGPLGVAEAEARNKDEKPQVRCDLDLDEAGIALQYFAALHAEDKASAPVGPTTAPAAGGQDSIKR